MTDPDVRPSPISEILDRTSKAYVRGFVPLFAILAVFAIPVALLEFYTQSSSTRVFDVVNHLLTLPAGDAAARAHLLEELNHAVPSGWTALVFFCELIVYPLSRTALIVFAAQSCDGLTPSVGSAYRAALTRWFPQLGVEVIFAGLALAGAIAFVIAFGLGISVVTAAAAVSRVVAVTAGSIVGLAAGAVAVAIIALANFAWLMASVGVVIEAPNPVRAAGGALRRTLDRQFLRRTFGIALAIFAVDWFGALAIVPLAAVVAYFTHLPVLYALAAACARALIDGAIGVFVVLYVREVAQRREGTDLLVSAPSAELEALDIPDRNDGLDRDDRVQIAQFLARRTQLEPGAAAAIAAQIADRVRPKLRASFHYLDDVALLEHLGRPD